MKRVNYKSDFDFILPFPVCQVDDNGERRRVDLGWPDFDWEARFWASTKANMFIASRKGDVLTNCFNDNGRIHIVCDSPRMGKGELKVAYHAELPNGIYPDKTRDMFSPYPIGIELVDGPGDCATEIEVEYMLPYLKGAPFTYDDFTPEQIADIKRPAVEAAERADKAAEKADKSSKLADNAASRATSEADRAYFEAIAAQKAATNATQISETVTEAESTRIENEKKRVSAESTRESEESARVSAERTREQSESVRVGNENQRISGETGRVNAESQRAAAEALRVSDEQSRVSAEAARVQAEQNRASEFGTLKTQSQTATSAANSAAEAANSAADSVSESIADALIGKADVSQLSNVLAVDPLTPWEQPDMPAYRRLFVDMWNEAWIVKGEVYGKYDPDNAPDADHPFMGNGIWMTYEEAVIVMQNCANLFRIVSIAAPKFAFANSDIRTTFPLFGIGNGLGATTFDSTFKYCIKLETVHFINGNQNLFVDTFYECFKLKDCLLESQYNTIFGDRTFFGCAELETLYIKNLNSDLNIKQSPKISRESLAYIISHSSGKAITITLHHDAYARVTDELFAAALEKNITIASA